MGIFHHIDNNSDDKNKYFHNCNKNIFRFQVLLVRPGSDAVLFISRT